MDFKTYQDLLTLYSDYAMACDSSDWEKWPDFFTDDGIYRLQPRENFEQGLPLCLLAMESKAMMMDRVFGVRETLYHDPYYQRHVVGTPRVVEHSEQSGISLIHSEANYIVVRTKFDGESTVFSAGFYRDIIEGSPTGMKFKLRLAVYDTEMVANSVIYPI